ncbi:MAG TPA: rhomboid family intramembrane serine protease [Candidatus Udaeobacter sp.]
MARLTRLLIGVNVAVFALEAVSGPGFLASFALWPVGHFFVSQFDSPVGFKVWQLITCGFLHANFLHLAINMYALWMFGSDVERVVGPRHYLILYFASLFSSSATQLLVVSMMMSSGVYPTVGASGAIFGILLAFGMLFPRRTIVLLIPPIPMPAIVFVILYALLELFSGIFGTNQGVAHFAHLGGMVGAYLTLRHWRKREQLVY